MRYLDPLSFTTLAKARTGLAFGVGHKKSLEPLLCGGSLGGMPLRQGRLKVRHKVDGVALHSLLCLVRLLLSWLTDTSLRPLATEWVSVHWVGREP